MDTKKEIKEMKFTSSTRFLAVSLAKDLAKAAVVLGLLFLVGSVLFDQKENLFFALTHKDLTTMSRVTYETHGEAGLKYGLGAANTLLLEEMKQ